MQALDLDVENGVGVDLHPGFLLQIGAQGLLILVLDVQQAAQSVRIVLELQQLFQLPRVLLPAGADLLGDEGGQLWVAVHEPPAESDAVCLVVKLLRIDLSERLELGLL